MFFGVNRKLNEGRQPSDSYRAGADSHTQAMKAQSPVIGKADALP
jgi:hypothetical protein